MLKTIFAVALLITSTAYAESPEGRVVQVDYPPMKVEVDPQYQEGSPVKIKLDELFPHSCYKSGPTELHVSGSDILIRNTALLYDGYVCLTALYPHQKVVEIGELPAGTYRLLVTDGRSAKEAARFVVDRMQ